jgi:signal transduction histidine kinase
MASHLLRNEAALKQRVEEVERATEEVQRTQGELVRSERLASVGRLAAGVAHEIGNPLAAILGLIELLLEMEFSEAERKDFLRRVRHETQRIHGILSKLLDYARAPRKSSLGSGNVGDAVSASLALLRPQKELQEMQLESEVPPGLPRVRLDGNEIQQVVLNLVMNAVDAAGARGRIRVRAEQDGGDVRLCVEDDGPGVREDLVERLFEPFVSSKDVGRGTGLGLAVCRGLVESVGGSIRLTQGVLPGACFEVALPIVRNGDAGTNPPTPVSTGES